VGDGQWVLAVAHQHGRADHLVAALDEDAAAELRAQLHPGHVFDVDGRAAALGDDGVLDVPGVLDPTDAADQVLGVVLLHDAAADGRVAARDGLVQLAERQVVGAQGVGIDVDLVFQRRTTDGTDLGHAAHGVDLRPDVILLQGPAATRLQLAALDRVPEDLP